MTDVRLDRADPTETLPFGVECTTQRIELDRVTLLGAGAVGLDIGDALGVHAGRGMGGADHRRLPLGTRRGEADLAVAVVVDRRAADHRVDVISIGEGPGQRLEQDGAAAVAENRPVGPGVEGAAMAVRGDHQPFVVEVAPFSGERQRGGAGQRHLALAGTQRLAGEVHGHERRGAGGQQREARTLQVQLVGQPRREVVAVREQERVDALGGVQRRPTYPARPLFVLVGAEVDTDTAVEGSGVVTGVLERLPGALVHHPGLRVHPFGLLRRVAEELRVEAVDVVDDTLGLHVVGMAELRGADALLLKLAVGEERDRLATLGEHLPELADVAGSGKAAGEADDGDLTRMRGSPPVPAHEGTPVLKPGTRSSRGRLSIESAKASWVAQTAVA